MSEETKGGTGGGKTLNKTWLEGPPWKNADKVNEILKGTKTSRYKKSKCYPSNYKFNEVTGRYEKP